MLHVLRFALFSAGILAVLIALYFLFKLFVRERRAAAARNPRQDLANMMILFQTMRDLLRQQKDLARQFNENVEHKLALIRKTIGVALDDHEKLVAAHRDLSVAMEEAKADLTSIQRQLSYLNERPAHPLSGLMGGESPVSNVPIPNIAARSDEAVQLRRDAMDFSGLAIQGNESALHAKRGAPPAPPVGPQRPGSTTGKLSVPPSRSEDPSRYPSQTEKGRDESLVDDWVGMDFAQEAPPSNAFHGVPQAPPEAPEDIEAARQAFRALLNLHENQPAPPRQKTTSTTPTLDRSGNGKGHVPPLHGRVYEYSDAGMTAGQIARELGVGKGEVRLILSLRQDKEQ